MSPEAQAIIDCGSYARLSGFPIDECPNYPSAIHVALWQSGWRKVDKMTKVERDDLRVRKQLASLVAKD